jgi:hypothetical protein
MKAFGGGEAGAYCPRQPADRLIEIPGALREIDDRVLDATLRQILRRMTRRIDSGAPMYPDSRHRAEAPLMRYGDMDDRVWSIRYIRQLGRGVMADHCTGSCLEHGRT